MSGRVTIYLNEQKAVKLSDAAVLADEYVLTHKSGFEKPVHAQFNDFSFKDGLNATVVLSKISVSNKPSVEERGTRESPVCFYCKKQRHILANFTQQRGKSL